MKVKYIYYVWVILFVWVCIFCKYFGIIFLKIDNVKNIRL